MLSTKLSVHREQGSLATVRSHFPSFFPHTCTLFADRESEERGQSFKAARVRVEERGHAMSKLIA